MADFKKIWCDTIDADKAFREYCLKYYSADFAQVWPDTLKYEGGYSSTSGDSGNWTGGSVNSGNLAGTNFGISAPVLSSYLGRPATAQDSQNLTVDTAMDIAKQNYWNKINGDLISNQALAAAIFDFFWNSGSYGTLYAAKTANQLSGKTVMPEVKSSGLTPSQVNIINSLDPKAFFNTYMQYRADFIKGLSNYNTFGQGLMNRITSIYDKYAPTFAKNLVSLIRKNPVISGVIFVVAAIGITTLIMSLSSSYESENIQAQPIT